MTVQNDIDLRCGRWEDVLGDVECDALITDPPYSARVHDGQRTGTQTRKSTIEYDAISPEACSAFAAAWAPRVRHWAVMFSDHVGASWWEAAWLSVEWYVFAPVIWLRANPTPRLAGDGPTSACDYLIVARPRRRLAPERTGSRPGYYIARNLPHSVEVAGGKQIDPMRALVRDYSLEGDLIADPFSGGGTTLLAAAIEGRRAVGAELDPAHFNIAQKRIKRGYTPTLFYRRSNQGDHMPPRKKKTENQSTLPLPDELTAVAEKYRNALVPLAEREVKLEAELRDVREQRIALEGCLLPLEKVIADQRARVEAANRPVEGCAVANAVIAAEMSTSKVGDHPGLGA